jgi:hypothetical protein
MLLSERLIVCAGIAGLLAGGAVLSAQAGYAPVDLQSLANFNYRHPDAAAVVAGRSWTTSIPARIQALDGRSVSVVGYMLPYTATRGLVRQFMLVLDMDNCRFGDPPNGMNDWIDVNFKEGRAANYIEGPARITGVFSVGEIFDRDGFVVSIYRLDGHRAEPY